MADEFKSFPKWKYHAELPACVVRSLEEDQALGEEWADTPAAFLVKEEPKILREAKSKAKAEKDYKVVSKP